MNETIVLVPGMYSPRWVLFALARRLRKRGYTVRTLSNRFLSRTPAQNAQTMLQQIQSFDANTVHLLGHSLGGIVVMHMLQQNSELPATQQIPDGRVVLMAAPVQGSQLARWMNAKRWLKPLLGNSVHQGVLGQAPLDLHGRIAGVIHGSSRAGLTAMLFRLPGVNDGVVSESETALKDASDTICIPHSHALMLFSTESVDKVATFIQHGRFV